MISTAREIDPVEALIGLKKLERTKFGFIVFGGGRIATGISGKPRAAGIGIPATVHSGAMANVNCGDVMTGDDSSIMSFAGGSFCDSAGRSPARSQNRRPHCCH